MQQALVESGSTILLIKMSASLRIQKQLGVPVVPHNVNLRTLSQDPVALEGKMCITINVGSTEIKHDVLICNTKCFAWTILLGSDFLRKTKANIDYNKEYVGLCGYKFFFNKSEYYTKPAARVIGSEIIGVAQLQKGVVLQLMPYGSLSYR